MDFEKARFNMVEQQIRPWEVLDQRVLDLMLQIKREDFVPAEQKSLAFVDMELPLANGAVMLAPKVEARIAQELNLRPEDRILEIGTGNGYLTALLASLGQHVYSVDIDENMIESVRTKLAHAGIRNISLKVADGMQGLPDQAPFDVIVLGGSVPVLPDALKQQLTVGGRLFAIIGEAPLMEAKLIVRESEQGWRETVVFETCTGALQAAPQSEKFTF